jgi:pseudouridine kinase
MNFCVIGGMNMDVTGYCLDACVMHDSNPGRIRFSPGGVGRNIACCLAEAGHRAELITCVTDDLPGRALREDCARRGVGLKYALEAQGSAPCYMSLHTPDGDMLAAVNDMAALDGLDAACVRARAEAVNAFDACVIDTNLPPETLREIASLVSIPLIADAVSVHKCFRLLPLMPRLAAIKPNEAEARALTGLDKPEDQAKALVKMGAARAVISLGKSGVYAMDEKGGSFLAAKQLYTCQATGAGDALCAGICEGVVLGLGAIDCAFRGMEKADALLRNRQFPTS